jgi:hypothetical protein
LPTNIKGLANPRPFLCAVADMRQLPARTPATERLLPADGRAGTPASIVCTALALAVLALAVRIVAVW